MRRPRRPRPDAARGPVTYLDDAALMAHLPFVRALVRAMGVRRDAEDIVQEIMAGAWHSMMAGRFRPTPGVPLTEAIRAWLHGITWRRISATKAKAWRRWERPHAEPYAHPDALGPVLCFVTPEDEAAAREVVRALNSIPRNMRELLVAFYCEGFDAYEIAEMTGVSTRAVYYRVYHAASMLLIALNRSRKA